MTKLSLYAGPLSQRKRRIMKTNTNIEALIRETNERILPTQETSLEENDLHNLLYTWFHNLEKPSPPKDVLRGVKTQEYQESYFDRLEEGIEEIFKRKDLPPPPSRSYLERICRQNNPYDFAVTVEKAVAGILHFDNKIEPDRTFFLYYFHRRQLEEAASQEWFSSYKQIGRIWA